MPALCQRQAGAAKAEVSPETKAWAITRTMARTTNPSFKLECLRNSCVTTSTHAFCASSCCSQQFDRARFCKTTSCMDVVSFGAVWCDEMQCEKVFVAYPATSSVLQLGRIDYRPHGIKVCQLCLHALQVRCQPPACA